jgi:hypothetical protein
VQWVLGWMADVMGPVKVFFCDGLSIVCLCLANRNNSGGRRHRPEFPRVCEEKAANVGFMELIDKRMAEAGSTWTPTAHRPRVLNKPGKWLFGCNLMHNLTAISTN